MNIMIGQKRTKQKGPAELPVVTRRNSHQLSIQVHRRLGLLLVNIRLLEGASEAGAMQARAKSN